MAHGAPDHHAGAMTTPPVEDLGPRVSGEEMRDLGRLRRSSSDRRIAGVAGGIARHLDIDPLVVRVTLVVLVFFGGSGLLVYAACWLLVPSDDTGEAVVRLDARSRSIALLVAGALAALSLLGDSLGGWGFPWPVAVLGLLVLVYLLARGRDRTAPSVAPGPSRRRGPLLFGYALALIAVVLGTMGMIDVAGADVAPSAYPATALAICGALLVLGAFWGRGGGIILLGVLSLLVTAGVCLGNEISTGKVVAAPTTAAEVQADYRIDAGQLSLDLTDVEDLAALDGRTITVVVELGRADVYLPAGLDVTITSEVALGDRSVLGVDTSNDSGTTRLDGGTDAPSITLDVTVGLGAIQIREGDS